MGIGRPLEFDPEVALKNATELFWRRGYEATSLQDLLGATGLSKSSLYQTFGSKHELFEQCMSAYRHRLVRDLRERLDASPCGLRFIESVLLEVAKEAGTKEARAGVSS
ncbi:MAG: helix-turn-helix domain-containing protein [Candidatus Eisenbacteria bacterium]